MNGLSLHHDLFVRTYFYIGEREKKKTIDHPHISTSIKHNTTVSVKTFYTIQSLCYVNFASSEANDML